MDRKTIMSWLEGLAQSDWREFHSDSEVQNIAKAVLALLKEQEAVEPKKENDGTPEPWTSWWFVCGECHVAIDRSDIFCRHCGRKVKWE